MKKFFYILLFIIVSNLLNAQNNIIPAPVNYEANNTEFLLDSTVSFTVMSNNKKVMKFTQLFQKYLSNAGINIPINQEKKSSKNIIVELLNNPIAELGKEGYLLTINNNIIIIKTNQPEGVFNAFQTLKQLLPTKFNSPIIIGGCSIKDYPRFGWRGLMLDVSRHFFTVEEVKAYLDKMSEYKFNVFHWHLTDDQGWRIEIKSLPKLTEVGAWRVKRYGRFGSDRAYPKPDEKATYGGFYTQKQIKDIINYAADRNITLVPEIDMPGHSMAALAAYPELSTKKEPKFVAPGVKFSEWYGDGNFKMLIENTLNPTDEKVYDFVDKVFTEVAALFPGKYIHMGGDEAYHGYWKEDPKVQKFMKKHNIKNTHELQSYFVKRVEKIISSKGKKMIGWDEIIEGGLPKEASVMSWRGMKGGIEAAKEGHNVVMSPTTYAYLDYTQGDPSVENKIYASLNLKKAYSFEPIPEGIDPNYILGGQGNLWTEAVPTLPYAFYMTYPRAFAIAETMWSPKNKKDWDSFILRVEEQIKRFDASQTNISKTIYEPIIDVYYENDKLMCKLSVYTPNTDIYYTIDNTYPAIFGEKYSEPFEISEGDLSLRTHSYRNGKPIGRELRIQRTDLVKRVKN